MDWQNLLLIITGAGIVFLLYQSVKNNPSLFSKANFSKSFKTMGLLALGLIAFVAFLVLLLKT